MAFEVDPRTLLNKLAFGPSDADLHSIAKVGAEGWLGQQLKPPVEDDCAARIASTHIRLKYSSKTPEAEVDEDRSLAVLAEPIEQHWKVVEKALAGQERTFFRTAVACATTIRAVHSRWQLREVLVDFWHNHFNVNALGDNLIAVALPTYDNEVIRRHALGNFRELLEAVAKSAAMQIYLNNRSSRGGAANENYARELFELHALGRPAYLNALYNRWRDVPGALEGRPQGYIDQDVYEAARAFTGWAIVHTDAFRRSAGSKVKRPLELYASFARSAGIAVAPTPGLLGELDGSGQRLFGWGPPTGHPDENDYWLSSAMMRRRWSLLLGLADDAWKAGAPQAALAVAEKTTAEHAAGQAYRRMFGA